MLKHKRVWIPVVVIGVIAVMIYGLLHGQKVANQEPIKIYKAVEVEKPASQPKPPPPGETHETGHWHGDHWHSEPHETPSADVPSEKVQTSDAPSFTVAGAPVAWSNPLMPDEIPEHLKMPTDWVNWDYMSLIEEKEPQRYAEMEQRLGTLVEAVIENYNPKRPIAELWDDFIEAEKLYHAHSEHAKKYPLSIVSGFRADWYYQGIWNFPEIFEMIRSEGGLKGQWYNVFRVEMGDHDPDWNLFHLHDGREFRVRDDVHYEFYTDYNEDSGDYSNMYAFSFVNPETAETIKVYPDTMSDAELQQLQGWNYNVNPYTGKPISR